MSAPAGNAYRIDPATVLAVASDRQRPRQRSASGYGAMLPTRWRVQLSDHRWRRVYAMCYGNAASVYVRVAGREVFLDTATEYALTDGLSDPTLGACS